MFTARQSELHEQVHGHMRVDTFMQRVRRKSERVISAAAIINEREAGH